MSSEEESFIILGDSPSLVEPYSLLQLSDSMLSSMNTGNTFNSTTSNQNNQIDKKLVTDSPPSIQSNGNDYSLCNEKKNGEISGQLKSVSPLTSMVSNPATDKENAIENGSKNVWARDPGSSQQPLRNLTNSQAPISKTNLAESFLLGAIDCDTMKVC